MSNSFAAHVKGLNASGAEAADLAAAARSADALLVYAEARNLDLSPNQAVTSVALASAPLSDSDLDQAAGGLAFYKVLRHLEDEKPVVF